MNKEKVGENPLPKSEKPGFNITNKYIVKYAPLSVLGGLSIQDIRTMMVHSKLSREEAELELERRFDKANANNKLYNGMLICVCTLEGYLDSLPTEVI